jgi:transposase InsO family protein
MIAEAVKIYNNERLHWSLELKTPQEYIAGTTT